MILTQLYVVQGIPVGLAFDTYPTLLRDGGVSLAVISLIPLASLPWVIKFIWAPIVENHWSADLGRRKSWLVPMQFLLALFILLIAFIPFTEQTAPSLLVIITLSCFAGATQDIAADGLASDSLKHHSLGKINGIQASGSIFGMLIGGTGVTICSNFIGKTASIFLLAALVFISVIVIQLWREPDYKPPSEASKAKVRDFFKRDYCGYMLFLALLVPFTGSVVYGIAKLILIDNGFSVSQVGAFTGVGGYVMMLVGCGLASWLMKYRCAYHILPIGIVLLGGSCLIWLIFCREPSMMTFWTVLFVMVAIGVGIGITNVSVYSLLMQYASASKQSTTDYSMFQSTLLFSEIIAASLSITVADQFGYSATFLVGVGSAALTLLWVSRVAFVRIPQPQE